MAGAVSILYKNSSEIFQIISMSLFVSITSTLIGGFVGFLFGIPTAIYDFKIKKLIMGIVNTFMGLPPVLMGLMVYMLLSRKGPLGNLGILFTPAAMIIAQTLLIVPIIFGLTVSSISKSVKEIQKTCKSLGADRLDTFLIILKECRVQLLTVITAGFGRAISEVGAVMMVGGNIRGYTRVMTTYIALETGKGNFNEALIIGGVLLLISFVINFIIHRFQGREY